MAGTDFTLKRALRATILSSTSIVAELALRAQRGFGWAQEVNFPPRPDRASPPAARFLALDENAGLDVADGVQEEALPGVHVHVEVLAGEPLLVLHEDHVAIAHDAPGLLVPSGFFRVEIELVRLDPEVAQPNVHESPRGVVPRPHLLLRFRPHPDLSLGEGRGVDRLRRPRRLRHRLTRNRGGERAERGGQQAGPYREWRSHGRGGRLARLPARSGSPGRVQSLTSRIRRP